MSVVSETYEILQDLKKLVEKKKDKDLSIKFFELQDKFYELKEENEKLNDIKKIEKNIERHIEWPYITLKNDEQKIQYCAICWGRDKKLIQTFEKMCPECNMIGERRKQKINY